jgi:dTDP-4-dehydrorhamnose 3,5-epimerase-like enzyme
MSLEKEQSLFEQKKGDFLKHHEGQFVLIKEGQVHGFFPTEHEAFDKGIELFGPQDMFIKQILKDEPKTFIPAFSAGHHAGL